MNSEKENTIKSESRSSEGTNVDRGTESVEVDKPVAEDVAHAVRHATGPRTTRGRMKSRRNATKHGIFSRIVVLDGESQIEYESLLFGLRQYFKPVGALEDLLVEQLATNRWRYRRLLMAERGETGANAIPTESELTTRASRISALNKATSAAGGLIEAVNDSFILNFCLLLLQVLRAGIRANGFQNGTDHRILQRLYGPIDQFHVQDSLYRTYSYCVRISELPEDERESKNHPSPPECLKQVLQAIDDETKRLEQLKEKRACAEAERCSVQKLRHSIPEGPRREHLLRYEASLDRSFDRILHQLERAQRMRRGQPVAPPINVQISG